MAFFLTYLLKTSIESDSAYFLEYLTVWGLILLVVYFTWSALTVTYTFARIMIFKKPPHKTSVQWNAESDMGCCGRSFDSISWYHRILWILFTISTETAVAITLLFWTVLYNSGMDIGDDDIAMHLLNGLLAYFDLWITGIPVRIYHFYLACLFGCVYSGFTGIHYATLVISNATSPIYPVLDYSSQPSTAILFAVLCPLILAPIVHLFFYGSYLLRQGLLFGVRKYSVALRNNDQSGINFRLLMEEDNQIETA